MSGFEALVQQCLTRGRELGVAFETLHGQYSLIEAQFQQNGFLPDSDALRKQEIESQAAQVKAQMENLQLEIDKTPGLAAAVEAALGQQQRQPLSTGPQGFPLNKSEAIKILCCKCGVPTEPNELRVCVNCIQVDITEGIPRLVPVKQCPACKRYLGDQHMWLNCEWESNTLMALCLKKLSLKKVIRLVDAKFVYTEPHSRRIKINFVVEKDVIRNCTMRQEVLTMFVVQSYQCPDCTKSVTPHHWIAQVQVRQRSAEHKRTMLYLEQLVLKDHAHSKCTNIMDKPDGLDFCFSKESDARDFVAWVKGYFGVKLSEKSTQVVSEDLKNNTAHNKYVYCCELPPICRDDLIFLPKKHATALGGCSQFMLCRKIGRSVSLIDPYSLRGIDLDHVKFWKKPLKSCMSKRDLFRYMVLNIEEVNIKEVKTAGTAGRFLQSMTGGSAISAGASVGGPHQDGMFTEAGMTQATSSRRGMRAYKLVDVEIVRCEAGSGLFEGQPVTVRTHLGHFLNVGDHVLGYDLSRTNKMEDEAEFEKAAEKSPYNIILARKEHVSKERGWVVKTLKKDQADGKNSGKTAQDESEAIELFKQDVEQDKEMAANINLYRNPKMPKGSREDNALALLIQNMTINEVSTDAKLEEFM